MAGAGLSFDWERRGDTAQLVVGGQLDLETAQALAHRAVALLDDGAAELVLDLSGVTFCDSAGISALFQVYDRADDLGVPFVLRNLNATVFRVLDATGLSTIVAIDDTPPGGIPAVGGR